MWRSVSDMRAAMIEVAKRSIPDAAEWLSKKFKNANA